MNVRAEPRVTTVASRAATFCKPGLPITSTDARWLRVWRALLAALQSQTDGPSFDDARRAQLLAYISGQLGPRHRVVVRELQDEFEHALVTQIEAAFHVGIAVGKRMARDVRDEREPSLESTPCASADHSGSPVEDANQSIRERLGI